MNTLEIKNVTYSYANSKEKVLSLINQGFNLENFMRLSVNQEQESQLCFHF